jgi:hypothetical protein
MSGTLGKLTMTVQWTEVEIGTGVIDRPVERIAPEERVRDDGCKCKGETRASALVIDALATLKLRMSIMAARIKRKTSVTHVAGSQEGVKDQAGIRQGMGRDTCLALHVPSVRSPRPTEVWQINVVVPSVCVAKGVSWAQKSRRRVRKSLVQHSDGCIREFCSQLGAGRQF